MKSFQNKKIGNAALGLLLFAIANVAFAAPGTAGGLATAEATAKNIQTGLFALVGTGAASYLIFTGVMAFMDKKTWGDFGMAVVYVSLVGASVALAAWAWALFQ
ncbi:TrbC/VirB2 family protein [Massilia sp. CCM 9210]|uniref:TrbC/VirB2 family protein n=1 Tax=Massilia scottii TaxID=3057166 RepID=UPI002796DBCC|nr:TrbC/VirB2 family protein [Massilia sp. CCM 9210]MDQ1817818.1 TrbC/VirB2 family protein [Massilia sp. CCM 9210]